MKEVPELVSIIVVNFNGKEYLEDGLNSLAKQSHPYCQVILVDNASTDGSVEYVRSNFPWVGVIENGENLGFGRAVNEGLAQAKGQYVLFLNDDLQLHEYCVEKLLVTVKEAGVGGAVPKILFFERPDEINSFGVALNYLGLAWPNRFQLANNPELVPGETAVGGIFLAPRLLLEEVGGFDPSMFLYHEDSDLSWRIRLQGLKLLVNPEAVMYHRYHFSKNPDKFYHSEKNRIVMLVKNYSGRSLLLLLPALVGLELAELIFAFRMGWLKKKLKSYLEIGASLREILSRRRQIQRTRRVSDREIVSLFSSRLASPGVKNWAIPWLVSPLISAYWKVVRWII